MNLKSLIKLAAFLLFAASTPKASAYETQFGPFFGNAVTSVDGQVSYHNGYFLSLRHSFETPLRNISLAPIVEFSNAFTNIEHSSHHLKQDILYDHRILSGGVHMSVPVGHTRTFIQAIYMTVLAGKTYSKANMAESSDETYQQSFFQDISGSYWAGQVGVQIPIKGSLALDVAYLNTLQLIDQSKDLGDFDREYMEDGQKYTLSDSYTADNRPIPTTASIRSYAMKLGLSVGF